MAAGIMLGAIPGAAQCTLHVPWISGSAAVGNTTIAVVPFGSTTNSTDCGGAVGPYVCGFPNPVTSGFTFTFFPPVDSVRLDVSALHRSSDYDEIMRVFVNGAHYAIPSASTEQNECNHALAVLTAQGDLRAGGSGSYGSEGTIVPGPISTLTVKDSIPFGDPAGAFFAIFLCEGGTGIVEAQAAVMELFPNPANDQVTVRALSPGTTDATVIFTDVSGKVVMRQRILGNDRSIDVSTLAEGIYLVSLENEGGISVERLMKQ